MLYIGDMLICQWLRFAVDILAYELESLAIWFNHLVIVFLLSKSQLRAIHLSEFYTLKLNLE